MFDHKSTIIKRAKVTPAIFGDTVISWELGNSVTSVKAVSVYARPLGVLDPTDWALIGTTTDLYLTDESRRNYDTYRKTQYKLVVDDVEYFPVHDDTLSRKDFLIAREIVRREKLLYRKFTGLAGMLYRRKIYGPACTSCVDANTGETTNANCDTCYGVGKLGGYYSPVELYALPPQPAQAQQGLAEQQGAVEIEKLMVRMTNFPLISYRDVWYDTSNHKAYYVNNIQPLATIGNLWLVVSCELGHAPTTDAIYILTD